MLPGNLRGGGWHVPVRSGSGPDGQPSSLLASHHAGAPMLQFVRTCVFYGWRAPTGYGAAAASPVSAAPPPHHQWMSLARADVAQPFQPAPGRGAVPFPFGLPGFAPGMAMLPIGTGACPPQFPMACEPPPQQLVTPPESARLPPARHVLPERAPSARPTIAPPSLAFEHKLVEEGAQQRPRGTSWSVPNRDPASGSSRPADLPLVRPRHPHQERTPASDALAGGTSPQKTEPEAAGGQAAPSPAGPSARDLVELLSQGAATKSGHGEEFLCSIGSCPRSRPSNGFSHLSNLRQHLRAHLGHRPYRCRYPGCSKAYAHPTSRNDHEAVFHRGERPYSCTVSGCSRGFTSRANLSRHLRDVHDVGARRRRRRKGSASPDSDPQELSSLVNGHQPAAAHGSASVPPTPGMEAASATPEVPHEAAAQFQPSAPTPDGQPGGPASLTPGAGLASPASGTAASSVAGSATTEQGDGEHAAQAALACAAAGDLDRGGVAMQRGTLRPKIRRRPRRRGFARAALEAVIADTLGGVVAPPPAGRAARLPHPSVQAAPRRMSRESETVEAALLRDSLPSLAFAAEATSSAPLQPSASSASDHASHVSMDLPLGTPFEWRESALPSRKRPRAEPSERADGSELPGKRVRPGLEEEGDGSPAPPSAPSSSSRSVGAWQPQHCW